MYKLLPSQSRQICRIAAALLSAALFFAAAFGGFFAFFKAAGQTRPLGISSESSLIAKTVLPDSYARLHGIKDIAFDGTSAVIPTESDGVLGIKAQDGSFFGSADGNFIKTELWYGLLFALDAEQSKLQIFDTVTSDVIFTHITAVDTLTAAKDFALVQNPTVDTSARLYILYPSQILSYDLNVTTTNPSTATSAPFVRAEQTLYLDYSIKAQPILHEKANAINIEARSIDSTKDKLALLASGTSFGRTIWTIETDTSVFTDIFSGEGYAIADFCGVGTSYLYLTDAKGILVGENGGYLTELNLGAAAGIKNGALSNVSALTAFAGQILFAGAYNGYGYIQSYVYTDGRLSFDRTLSSSAGSDVSNFDKPAATAAVNDKIYIADAANNRVVIAKGDTRSVLDFVFVQPSAVAADSLGRVYAVDKNGTRITVFDDAGKLIGEAGFFVGIRDIAVTAGNVLYAADGGKPVGTAEETAPKIYKSVSAGGYEVFCKADVKKLAANTSDDFLYALTAQNTLATVDASGAAPLDIGQTVLPDSVSDIAVDSDRSIFLLGGTSLTRLTQSKMIYSQANVFSISAENAAAKIGKLSSMSVVTLGKGDGYTVGDILLTDDTAACIRLIESEDALLSVKDYDETYTDPVDWAAPQALTAAEDVGVTTVRTDGGVMLYRYPGPQQTIVSLPKDKQLFILRQNLSDNAFYAYVLVEFDTAITYNDGNKDITTHIAAGYVLKDVLAQKAANTFFGYPHGRVLNENTAVYKYPSFFAPVVKSGGTEVKLPKNTVVEMQKFAYPYRDGSDTVWTAVKTADGTVGFIPQINLINNAYSNTVSRPRPNAVIVTDNIIGAEVYQKTENGYTRIDAIFLASGTRVSIVGRFDGNSEYTHISYTDNEGTLDCYVLTRNLDSDELNVVQAVAIVLLLLTLVAGVVVFVTRRRNTTR